MKYKEVILIMMALVFIMPMISAIDVTNCTDLQAMTSNLAGDYQLTNDIDCSDTVNWNGGEGLEIISDYEAMEFCSTYNSDIALEEFKDLITEG